jgi:hypothetical protein
VARETSLELFLMMTSITPHLRGAQDDFE